MANAGGQAAIDKGFHDRAFVMAHQACCQRECCNIDIFQKRKLLESCFREVHRMTRKEKKTHMRTKIESACMKGLTKGDYCDMEWTLGSGLLSARGVCRALFISAYDVSSTFLTTLCQEIKSGIKNNDRVLNDISAPPDTADALNLVVRIAHGQGIVLSQSQLCALRIPNSTASLNCYGWMKFYFDLVGDCIPNSDGEIHLEPCTIGSIYDEYKLTMDQASITPLGKSQFAMIWANCFPRVSIREFKAVTGKCDTCAQLSCLRREKRDNASRAYLTYLHHIHRTAYMGERMAYAERSALAVQMKRQYLSLISDGMAQSHCILPWLGNLSTFGSGVKQHMQGVLMHGRGVVIYRTFYNLKNSANVQIHTLLLTLEQIIADEGKIPDTLYYQIDGGSENIARVCYALCELIVSRGLVKQVFLTRLMVGHTHADIDAVFGRFWKCICTAHVNGPREYKAKIVESLSTANYTARVVDIFVVPDYEAQILPCVDTKFGCYCKEHWTQLQFIFTSVDVSNNFPLGCKTTYRAYCAEEVNEIIEDSNCELGLRAQPVKVSTFPKAADNRIEGMRILTRLPTFVKFQPVAFIPGSRDTFDKVLVAVRNYFAQKPAVVAEWEEWNSSVIPSCDDSVAYVNKHPLHVPLLKELFHGEPIDVTVPRGLSIIDNSVPLVYTTDCVSRRLRPTEAWTADYEFARADAAGKGIPIKHKVRKARKPKDAAAAGDQQGAKKAQPKKTPLHAQKKRTTAPSLPTNDHDVELAGVPPAAEFSDVRDAHRGVDYTPHYFPVDGSTTISAAAFLAQQKQFRTGKRGRRAQTDSEYEGSVRALSVSNGPAPAARRMSRQDEAYAGVERRDSDNSDTSSSDREDDSDDGEGGDTTDYDAVLDGWITKRTKFALLKSSAALYWGRCFKFSKALNLDLPYISNLQCGGIIKAKVSAIVVRASNHKEWAFQIYDCATFRSPPGIASGHMFYIPCVVFMSNLVHPHVHLCPVNGTSYGVGVHEEALVGRFIVKSFMSQGKPTDYRGQITRFDPKNHYYVVLYPLDCDTEEFTFEEIVPLLVCN